MKKREAGLDLFRLIGAFLVVNTHVMSSYTEGMVPRLESGEAIICATSIFYYILHACAYWVVPTFLMLSGAFSIASAGTKNVEKVYARTWKKMGIPTLIFTGLYTILIPVAYYLAGVIPEGKLGAYFLKVELPSALCGVPAAHMWYMYVSIVLYLMAPYIVMMRETVGEKKFMITAVILQIWGMIDNLFYDYAAKWDLGLAINLLGTFMMGYVIHEKTKNIKSNVKGILCILLGICGGVILGAINLHFMAHFPSDAMAPLVKAIGNQAPHNIWVVFSAICMFAGFGMLDINIDVNYLAELTYWVYLVHVAVMSVVMVVDVYTFNFIKKYNSNIAVMFAHVIIVYLLSFVVSHIIVSCMKKFGKKAEKQPKEQTAPTA